MTSLHLTFGQYFSSGRRLALLICAVLSASAVVGITAAQEPLLAIAVVLLALLAMALIIWPDVSTLAFFFILYSNAAAVAVQFHQVPFIIGASVPILLIIPLTSYLIFHRQKLIFHPILILMILFLAIQMIGTLFAVKITGAREQLIIYLTEGVGLYFLITNAVRTSAVLRRIIWVLLFAGALMGGLSFYQQVTQTFDNDYGGFAQVSNAAFKTGEENLFGEVEQPRLAGPIGEQNRYAQILLMLVPLGLFRFWGERSKWLRLLAAITTGFIGLGVALTFSRGAAVGFILMLVIMAFMRYIKLYQIVIILAGLVLLMQAVPEYRTRLTSLDALIGLVAEDNSSIAAADGSTQSRLTEMAAAGLVFFDHPWVGVGPGMFKYHYQEYAELVGLGVRNANRQAHSLFPGLAAETGGLGLLCFLAILFVTLRDLVRTRQHWRKSRPELANTATGLTLAIVSFLTTSLFLHYGYIRFFWTIMALAGVVKYIAEIEVSIKAELTDPDTKERMPAPFPRTVSS